VPQKPYVNGLICIPLPYWMITRMDQVAIQGGILRVSHFRVAVVRLSHV
jgi:hypothetical protein